MDKENALVSPSSESLLARLWPVVEREYAMQVAKRAAGATSDPAEGQEAALGGTATRNEAASGGNAEGKGISQLLRRLPIDWQPPASDVLDWNAPRRDEATRDAVEFSWAGETARHVRRVGSRNALLCCDSGF